MAQFIDAGLLLLLPTSGGSPPTADFSGTPTSGTAPLAVQFTDLSTGSPTSWAWTFGDAGTSTQQNPSHSYSAAGTYTVILTATNAGGSNAKTRTNYITVSAAVDHHDGEPRRYVFDEEEVREEVEARAALYRQSRERLRAELILAIDGPQAPAVLEVLRDAVPEELRLAAPDYEPDLRGMLADMSALKRIAQIAIAEERRRFDEDEEDVEFLLLS